MDVRHRKHVRLDYLRFEVVTDVMGDVSHSVDDAVACRRR